MPIATLHVCFLWALWIYWAAHGFIAWHSIHDVTHQWPMTQCVNVEKNKERNNAYALCWELLWDTFGLKGNVKFYENMHSFLHYCFHPCDGLERFIYEFCSHSIPAQWNILIPSVVQCGMWRRAVPTASNLCLLLRGCCGNSRLQHLWGATLCDLSLKSFGSALYRSRGIVVPCLPSREQYSSEKMPVCVRDDLYVVAVKMCHQSQVSEIGTCTNTAMDMSYMNECCSLFAINSLLLNLCS